MYLRHTTKESEPVYTTAFIAHERETELGRQETTCYTHSGVTTTQTHTQRFLSRDTVTVTVALMTLQFLSWKFNNSIFQLLMHLREMHPENASEIHMHQIISCVNSVFFAVGVGYLLGRFVTPKVRITAIITNHLLFTSGMHLWVYGNLLQKEHILAQMYRADRLLLIVASMVAMIVTEIAVAELVARHIKRSNKTTISSTR